MTIRTILIAVSGGSASAGALEAGFALARRFTAHVEACHVHADPTAVALVSSDGIVGGPVALDLMQQVDNAEGAITAAARRLFDDAVKRHGLRLVDAPPPKGAAAQASATWRDAKGYAPDLVAARARVFDLVVLGRSERVIDRPHSEAVEAAVLRSGRPVLLAPAKPQEIGRRIAIGWNGSSEAVHALTGALPLLAGAGDISVITIANTDERLGAEAVEHLAWHGVAATARFVQPVEGVGAGEQLLSTAREEGADLLVMGAYGHAPWRELLFGGATREVIGTSLLPILLAH